MMAQKKQKQKKQHLGELTIQDKFSLTRTELDEGLIERTEEIDMILTAVLCQENPLLVGPPGTAKSLLIDLLMTLMDNGKVFKWQVNNFTVPEELFGPISIKGMSEDDYYRITTGKLPEAHWGFLDEIFKANSAILNTLLRVLNEREYENGSAGVQKVPLICCLAASNEWPNDQEGGRELGALFDRFLFRKSVKYIVTQEGRSRLLWDYKPPLLSCKLTPQDITTARLQKDRIEFSQPAVECFAQIIQDLSREGIMPGDRRQQKAVHACRAFAYLEGEVPGEGEVKPEHLDILQHILWTDPVEQPQKTAQIVRRIANPIGSKIVDIVSQASEIINKMSATEAVPKLQDLRKQLEQIQLRSNNAKITGSINWINRQIKNLYDKVVGHKGDEE